MVPEDFEQFQKYFPKWKDQSIREIAVLSPSEEEYRLIKKVFPKANTFVYTIKSWNLDNPNKRHFDLICAINVFMYSRQPLQWFKNVLNACRYFWLQDLINRYRSAKAYPFQLGNDGDFMRYSFSPNIHSALEGAFDLALFKDRILDFHAYPTKVGNMHFLCCMKGNCVPGDIESSNKTISVINSFHAETVLRLKRIVRALT